MGAYEGVLKTVIPVALMIATGMICRKKRVVLKQGTDGIKSLIVNVCLPAVLFGAFYRTDFNADNALIAAVMYALCAAALGLGFVFKKALKFKARTAPFLTSGFEAGMLGYALYTLLFGADKISYFASVDLGQVLFVFTAYVTLLKKDDGGSVRDSLKTAAKSPVIISIVLGVLFGATGLGRLIGQSAAGGTVQYIIDFIKAPTAAAILFVVGYEIEFVRSDIRPVLSVIMFRMAAVGVLGAAALFALCESIPVNGYMKWAFILMFVLPPPFVLPVYVKSDSENAFISATLSLYTALSLIAFLGISVISKI